jgi:hypothetical protein
MLGGLQEGRSLKGLRGEGFFCSWSSSLIVSENKCCVKGGEMGITGTTGFQGVFIGRLRLGRLLWRGLCRSRD